MQKLLVLASTFALASCSDAGNSVTVGNSNPLGTVGGVVWDAASEMPLSGATVKIIAGGKAYDATTDADGLFSAGNVPAGNFIAKIEAMSYLAASINGTLGGAVGNFPVKDPIVTLGPIGLIQNNGTFSVKLVDELGVPAANITVTARPQVRWVSFTDGTPTAMGSYEVTAMSGMDGVTTFMGLPNYVAIGSLNGGVDSLPIDVPPVQVMGSMTVYSFLGGTFTFDVTHLGNSANIVDIPIIRLAGPATPLIILNSNVDTLRNMQAASNGTPVTVNFGFVSVIPYIGTTGPVTIEFNQSINKSSVRAQLYSEDGSGAGIAIMAVPNANVLTLTPASALTAATRYNLALHVDAAEIVGQSFVARELNTTVPLFVSPGAGVAVTVKMAGLQGPKSLPGPSPQPFIFQFSEPVGIGFGNTNVSCVAFYDNTTVNLDNDPNSLYPGEYDKTKATQLNCPTPGLDITSIHPIEPGQFPVTGFATKWQITYDDAPGTECKPGVAKGAGCTPPATGSQLFLKPSRASDGAGRPLPFKRPDGTTIADNDMAFSFPIPAP